MVSKNSGLTRRMIIIFWICLTSGVIFSQNLVQGKVIDSTSLEILSFAHVQNLTKRKGTITNESGEFELFVEKGDSLLFKFLGYEDKFLVYKRTGQLSTISLSRNIQVFSDIVVVADDAYLYQWVGACRKKVRRNNIPLSSKAFMNVVSYDGDKPIEFVESFYTADLQRSSVRDLKYKHGKSLLTTSRMDGYFMNIDISKGLSMYSLVDKHAKLPINPLQTSKKELRKKFMLELDANYEKTISIRFTPRVDNEEYFSGRMWIDKESGNLLELILEGKDQSQRIFRGVGACEVLSIEYRLKYGNELKGDTCLLSFVSLAYDAKIQLIRDATQTMDIRSESILHFYDYKDDFFTPIFRYPSQISDYRLYGISTVSSDMWPLLSQQNQIKYTETKKKIKDIMLQEAKVFTDTLHRNLSFFEDNYTVWDVDSRFSLKKKKKQVYDSRNNLVNVHDYSKYNTSVSITYDVSTQIFFDVVKFNNTRKHISFTFLDVFESFNEYSNEPSFQCYANLCLDLTEIYRRKLEEAISKMDNPSERELRLLHKSTMQNLNQELLVFNREVQAGQNIAQLKKWNERIKRELQVDNMTLFGI